MVAASGLGSLALSSVDRLASWADAYQSELSVDCNGYHLVVRPDRPELADALQELSEIADGKVRCSGQILSGSFQQRPFRIELRLVS
jgi:hypothetical protein